MPLIEIEKTRDNPYFLRKDYGASLRYMELALAVKYPDRNVKSVIGNGGRGLEPGKHF